MSQETPSAPSAQEAPEYTARMQQVRQIGQGTKGRGGKRKARQMREALRAGDSNKVSAGYAASCAKELCTSGAQGSAAQDAAVCSTASASGGISTTDNTPGVQGFESACSDALTKDNQAQDRFETWDELFGIDGQKEQGGERREGVFSSLVQQAMGALFCADDEQRRFAGKRKGEQPQASLHQGRAKEGMRVFGQRTGDGAQSASCNQSGADACQSQPAGAVEDDDAQPRQHVRPPQKRQLVYVTQQEGARKPGFAWVLAVSASTSFAVSVAVVMAMGMLGAGDVQASFAGWLL